MPSHTYAHVHMHTQAHTHTHTPSFHHSLIYSLILSLKTVLFCVVTALLSAGPMRVTEPTQEGVSLGLLRRMLLGPGPMFVAWLVDSAVMVFILWISTV